MARSRRCFRWTREVRFFAHAGFSEAESGECRLQIRGQVLEKVVEYLQWHARNTDRTEFNIKDFERKIPPELALELYVALLTQPDGRRLSRGCVAALIQSS